MSDKVDLRLDWCSYEAAKFAVEHWHYSKSVPAGKIVKFGAWEDGRFIGAVLYSLGANNNIGKPYGLKQTEICELTRVALTAHASPVSQIVSATLRMLKEQSPGLRLIVSYADQNQGHNGSIYQAANWFYVGEIYAELGILLNGHVVHSRSVYSKYGKKNMDFLRSIDPSVRYVQGKPKHKYLYPLDRAMRKQIAPLAKPYPKRESCGQSVEGDTTGDQPEEAGSIPAARSVIPNGTT